MPKGPRIDEVGANVEELKWCRKLSWSLQTENPDMPREDVLKGLRAAFSIWQDNQDTDVAFLEQPFGEQADIRIHWEEFPPGDNHYGYGEFPPPNCIEGCKAGKIRLNLRYRWTLDERPDSEEPIDLVTLAAHEIGHTLGIEHSWTVPALMHPHYVGSHRFLAAFDRQFYRYLYYQDERPPS